MDHNKNYFIYAFGSILNPYLSKEHLLLMLAGRLLSLVRMVKYDER